MLDSILLSIAKNSILSNFDKHFVFDKQQLISKYPYLATKGAAFVTLDIEHQLRGCIGSIVAHRTLLDDIIYNAHAAAFSDPRFGPLRSEELSHLTLEVSVLTAPELIEYTDFEDLKKVKSVSMKDWKVLSIKNLNFSYHEEERDLHLENISMDIHRGEKIALIGESGSGKTTFMKLVRDLYPINSGKILLDGKYLRKEFKEISKSISLIPQDPEIFSTTIKENITLGVGKSMDSVKKYTDMAVFTDVAESLPKKFNSSIVEKGVNLSGGQKQRLALARGLMASENKEIVLMDESTSSVDTRNELMIYHNIFNEFKEKTVIASIHRLHLLNMFDKIYYFDNGKLACSGDLDELLKKSKSFRLLWNRYNKSRGKF